MSIGDALSFEKFNLGDIWKNLKKDPKRLILGVDPASTWAWNKVLGRDDKPLVDQMGGPYDGRVFSVGHNNGGVYDRAKAAGINTGTASGIHDVAHVIAGAYGAAGAAGAIGGEAEGSSSGSGLFGLGSNGSGSMWSNPQTYSRFAGMMPRGGQQPQQQNEWIQEMQRQEEERKRQELIRQQLAKMLAAQQTRTPVLS